MFDIGTLQSLPHLRQMILVTSDHFGRAAKSCFFDVNDDSSEFSSQSDLSILFLQYNPIKLELEVVPNCLAAAQLLGRLWF